MEKYSFLSQIGWITLEGDTESLSKVSFIKTEFVDTPNSNILRDSKKQLNEFLSGKRSSFDIPLSVEGTDFQVDTWEALTKIPYGKTICYSELADKVGSPKAQRAVGMANNKNPLPIIVPCHRVIGKNGSLTGYAGGLEAKKFLLNLENNEDYKD
ncbi:methylated-DNA--[protein]-cysteine S-methyltransferase [bacterium]|nr:methylated-DNA--[protein]-cysteine S-methyltransferase [bacterium]